MSSFCCEMDLSCRFLCKALSWLLWWSFLFPPFLWNFPLLFPAFSSLLVFCTFVASWSRLVCDVHLHPRSARMRNNSGECTGQEHSVCWAESGRGRISHRAEGTLILCFLSEALRVIAKSPNSSTRSSRGAYLSIGWCGRFRSNQLCNLSNLQLMTVLGGRRQEPFCTAEVVIKLENDSFCQCREIKSK